MQSFDLTREPWIPCLFSGERAPRDVSLRAVFSAAHGIRELADPSPLVSVALHRLLLAIVHRVVNGPRTFDDWRALWDRGAFESAPFEEYLDRWARRLDLFAGDRPFFQDPSLSGSKTSPLSRLYAELASGNNTTLFDHTTDGDPSPAGPAEVARALVAHQAYALGGGMSSPFNLTDAPLSRGVVALALGETLFATLLLNLVRVTSDEPVPSDADDCLAWERDDDRMPDKAGTRPTGYLDYLTWQSRAIGLVPDGGVPGAVRCIYQQGLKIADDVEEPFMSYRDDEKKGRVVRRLGSERALWRDSHAILEQGLGSKTQLLRWLARIADELGSAAPQFRLALSGLVSNQAKIDMWRAERLPLPRTFLTEERARDRLRVALELAEGAGRAVRAGVRELARQLVAPMADAPGARIPAADDARNLAASLGGERVFWSRVEVPFHRAVFTLAKDAPADPATGEHPGLVEWSHTLRSVARGALREALIAGGESPRALKAQVRARAAFERSLAKAIPLPSGTSGVEITAKEMEVA